MLWVDWLKIGLIAIHCSRLNCWSDVPTIDSSLLQMNRKNIKETKPQRTWPQSVGVYSKLAWNFLALLRAFAELRRATFAFAISVCPSVGKIVCMEKLGYRLANVREFYIGCFLHKHVEKYSISVKIERTMTAHRFVLVWGNNPLTY
jgi:hypothetical protein